MSDISKDLIVQKLLLIRNFISHQEHLVHLVLLIGNAINHLEQDFS